MPYALCRHLKANGRSCESPALAGSAFCYFHRKLRERHRSLVGPPALTSTTEVVLDSKGYPALHTSTHPATSSETDLDLPLLEDRESVQVAISLVVSALARRRIDSRRAGAILYGLQLASVNAPHILSEPRPSTLVAAVARTRSGHDRVRSTARRPRRPNPPDPTRIPPPDATAPGDPHLMSTTPSSQPTNPNTTIGELRKQHGAHFAPGYGDGDTLGQLLGRAGVPTLEDYLKQSENR